MSNRSPLCAPPPPPHPLVRVGPVALAVLGLAGMAVVAVLRPHLRPAAANAAPGLDSSPLTHLIPASDVVATGRAVPKSAAAAAPRPAPAPRVTGVSGTADDAFSTSLATPPPPPRAPEFRLQSIIVGRNTRACLINDTPCRVGDSVGTARVESIDRDRVTLRANGEAIELRLATGRRAAEAGRRQPSTRSIQPPPSTTSPS